ncbi:MAG: preprotein translocase subunit YajC [Cellvibrio sp.]|nr:preprotein translocase subunit YajC [Cellvibrio sp.]
MSLIPSAIAQTTAAAPQAQSTTSFFVMLGLMFVVMYFLIIRPQRKRQKEHQNLMSALAKGDEVAMTSGIIGRVVKVDDTYIVIETGNNVELKFQKIAVHAVLPKGTIKSIEGA